MKFPSIQTLVQAILHTCKRFPLTIGFILIACFYSIRISHLFYRFDSTNSHYYFYNIIWSAYMGMLLSLVVVLYAERNHVSSKIKWLGGIITIVLVVAFYFSLPYYFSEGRLKQFILFMTGLHLLVAFIPFTAKGEVNGFWQYNKSLFLRVLASALYSCVLFIGLSLAILAVEKLFSVEIKSKWYMDLWICIFGGFSSIFFLAGFPAAFEKLELNQEYPKGLKIFTQYVLLPIITVYLIILYAYMIKIIGNRQWPYGWVSYLVLAFAIAGILSLLLIHPIKYEANNKWIPAFNRFFYIALCPLIVLLFFAIERRISEYGITEERYIVFGLSCWLAFNALYFLFSKTKSIKTIPISLFLIAFLISFGPWGVFAVSFRSQNNRLKQFLVSNNMLSEDQKIIPAKAKLHKGDASQISSIVSYLVNAHGYHSMQPYFSQNLDTMLREETGKGRFYTYQQSEKLLAYMKVDKYNNEEDYRSKNFFRIYPLLDDSLMTLSGYEYFINEFEINDNSDADTVINSYNRAGNRIQLLFMRNSGRLFLKEGTDSPVIFDLNALVKMLKKNDFNSENESNSFRQDSLILNGENKNLSAKCILNQIFVQTKNDTIRITRLSANIFLHFNNSHTNGKK